MLCLHRRATPDPSSVLFCPVLLACPAPHPTPWGSPRFKERLQLGYRLLREHNDVTGAATLLFDIAPASNAKDWVSSLAVRQAGAPAASAVLKQHSDITGHAPHMRQVCVTRISAAAATPPSQPSSTLACRNHPCPPPFYAAPTTRSHASSWHVLPTNTPGTAETTSSPCSHSACMREGCGCRTCAG